MRYLKRFFESTEKLYETIDEPTFDRWCNLKSDKVISESELSRIEEAFKEVKGYPQTMSNRAGNYIKNLKVHDNVIEGVTMNDYYVIIVSCIDDYYIVNVCVEGPRPGMSGEFFKCDTFEGLIQCIENEKVYW
jgi:hypothetical protein